MCLDIYPDDEKKTEKLKAREKPIIAYKILREKEKKLMSPYQDSIWIPNKIKVSNRRSKNPTQLTKKERSFRMVEKGLHFHQIRKTARLDRCSPEEIWKVEIQPKDIISTGRFNSCLSIVAHKAKLIKRVY